MKKTCKYAQKSTVDKEHIKCLLDGSIRKEGNGCPCKKWKPTLCFKINKCFDSFLDSLAKQGVGT